MREAVDRLRVAVDEHERTVTQVTRFRTLSFLGAAQYTLGHPADAVVSLQQAVQIAPPPLPPPELTVNLANAYLASGRREDARRILLLTLRNAPGNLEAQMMLRRLNQQSPDDPVIGTTLGESPEGAKKYLRTLSFSRVSSGGLDPGQVKLALAQMEHYLDILAGQVAARDQTISRLENDLERYRQIEDTLIENMIKVQQVADEQQRASAEGGGAEDQPEVTPLEALFHQKP